MTTNEIEAVFDEYTISHKGNMQCKCISGARGHLIAKIESFILAYGEKCREEERERIKNKVEELIDGNYDNPNLAGELEDYFNSNH